MGHQFERLSYSSESSLTLLIDDLARERKSAFFKVSDTAPEMENWLNALLLQSAPLLHSKAGRENLEAWLEQAEKFSKT